MFKKLKISLLIYTFLGLSFVKNTIIAQNNGASPQTIPPANITTFYLTTEKKNGKLSPVPNVRVIYNGKTTSSNEDGQVILPKNLTNTELNIVFTESVKPVMFDDNFLGWLTVNGKAEMHTFKLQKSNGKPIWKRTTTKIEQNKQVPPDTILVFLSPENLKFEESNVAKNNTNVVLPSVRIPKSQIKRLNMIEINFINISRYFSKVVLKKHAENNRYEIATKV